MFYEILGAYIDLSKVTEVWDHLDVGQSRPYSVFLRFDGMDQPVAREVNKYVHGELLAGRQAFAQLREALERRTISSPPGPWPYEHNGMAFDLSDLCLVEHVQRDIKTTYGPARNQRPSSTVRFKYSVFVAGQLRIDRVLDNTPDIVTTPLHAEHDRLVKGWIGNMERRAA